MSVIMLHSVGNHNSGWYQNWLSVSLEHFEQFCKFLHRGRYQTFHLDEWYELQKNPHLILKRQIILTFDDGYLDNWVFAYPILKKYQLKGTVFVNPEFVDPSSDIRPTLEDVWAGKLKKKDLFSLSYLNWEEIKQLDLSGILDVQSHSMSHNYYFKSDKIVDFYKGQDEYHWLAWLERQDQKPFWLTGNQKDFVEVGYPVFEFGRALGVRRFKPSDDFILAFTAKAQQLISNKSRNVLNELKKFSDEFKNSNIKTGSYESKNEMAERYRYELFESKRLLEEKLNKKIDFLCWPGGGYNELSIQISKEAGYKASTIASRERHNKLDNSQAYKRIQRFGLRSFLDIRGEKKYYKSKYALIHLFKAKRGSLLNKMLLKIKMMVHTF
ncbi:MAG: polysaccharide deacetylase family protein [Cyclobacteriaceae bacterium]